MIRNSLLVRLLHQVWIHRPVAALCLFLLVLATGAAAVASLVAGPENGVKITTKKLRVSAATGMAMMSVPGKGPVEPRWNLSQGLWVEGERVGKALSIDALKSAAGPQYYLKEGKTLYVNPALESLMNQAGGVAVVGYDTAVWWRQMARAGAALLFLTTVFLVLSPAQSIGGSTSSSGRRLVALDSLRGVAAMLVVICHLPQTLMNPAWVLTTWQSGELVRTHPVAEFVKFSPLGVLIHGPLMVHVFWVLSGLVLSLPFLQRPSMEKMGESVAKRYFRLMPLALVSTLMAFFFQLMGAGAWWVPYQQVTGWAAGGMMVVWPGGEGNLAAAVTAGVSLAANYNAPLWTIGLELVGSLALFAILACTYTLRRRALLWAVLWAFFALYTRQYYLADFMAGLLLALCLLRSGERVRRWFSTGRTWAVCAGVTILGTASPGWLTPWLGKVPDEVEKLLMIVAAAGFVLLAAFSGAAERILTVKPLVWLGERSFAIYVVHGIIQQVLGQGLVLVMTNQGVPVLPAVLVSVAATFLVTFWVADWLTRAVDLPSMVFANRIGRWISGRLPPLSQPGVGGDAGGVCAQPAIAGTVAPDGAGRP